MRTLLAAAAAASVAVTAARADDLPLAPLTSSHWSIATGETVSPSRDALSFELGWPGITFGYLHGLSDRADLGVKFDLLYGVEGTTDSRLGFGLNVPLRVVALRKDKVSVLLHIDPGLRTYVTGGDTNFLIRVPVGVNLGIQATPELRLAAGVDLPLALSVTPSPIFFAAGPQFGVAAEYFVDKDLLVGLNTRFGPLFITAGDGYTRFSFTTQVVVGYRL
jgi:hypothetical protein